MKVLELKQLEVINGGGEIGTTIAGACAAIGIAGALKWLVVSRTAAITIAVGCGINALGTSFDWW